MYPIRRWTPLLGLAALLLMGAGRSPIKPAGEPDVPARSVRVAKAQAPAPAKCSSCAPRTTVIAKRGLTAKAEAARAVSRPTRLDPLMAL